MTTVRFGVGVVIQRDGRYLLGLRRGPLGRGSWGFPGGHVEAGEDPLRCAARELHEETGLSLVDAQPASWSRHVDAASGQAYVTLIVEASAAGEPTLREPDKCVEWRWFEAAALPQPLFAPTGLYFATLSLR